MLTGQRGGDAGATVRAPARPSPWRASRLALSTKVAFLRRRSRWSAVAGPTAWQPLGFDRAASTERGGEKRRGGESRFKKRSALR